jgi:putative ATP-dependent endonuclease of OLD family
VRLRTVRIQNFRGITDLELHLDDTTVLIGENNTGKTTVLQALRYALDRLRSRRGCTFSEFDYHLADANSDPVTAPEIAITLAFAEGAPDTEFRRAMNEAIIVDNEGRAHLQLRVRSSYDPKMGDFSQSWEFLNAEGEPLVGRAASDEFLRMFQRTRPIFYLSALRDAAKEFGQKSQFWAPFLKGMPLASDRKEDLEAALCELNKKIIAAHGGFDGIRDRLQELQKLVAVGSGNVVSVDALPARLFDVLGRAQVGIASPTDARLPVEQHGEGTQSLAVLLLFDTFVRTRLSSTYDRLATPLIALEEPEAHLHPCAVRSMWRLVESLQGQRIIATHSGDLVAEVPLSALRRLQRRNGAVVAHQPDMSHFTEEDLRKLSYHVSQTRGELLFARAWLLVEGETDVCVLTEAARILGLSLTDLGVRCVPFQATAGVEPFLKLAVQLGIAWFGLVDGDAKGEYYHKVMSRYLLGSSEADRIATIPEQNMDVYLCSSGYHYVYARHLDPQKSCTVANDAPTPEQLVKALPNKTSKPAIALEVMMEMAQKGKKAVPQFISDVLEKALALAKEAT